MDIKIAPTFVDIMSKLFHSEVQIHQFHLQTKGKASFATHKALDSYYKGIPDLIDGLIETYQGKTKTLVTGYKSFPFVEYKNPMGYLESLKAEIEKYRITLKFEMDNINNQLQVVIDLIESTMYFLTFME